MRLVENVHSEFCAFVEKNPEFLLMDNQIFNLMSQFADDNSGWGQFESYQLECGAFIFVHPDKDTIYDVQVASNYYDGKLSTRALSLGCNLIYFSHMSFRHMDSRMFADAYHELRHAIYDNQFDLNESELSEIYKFLD